MTPDAAPAPVFVDDSGRRHRTVRVIGWVLGGVVAGYLALLGISLVGSPGLVPLSLPAIGRILPGPAAAQVAGAPAGGHDPGALISRASGRQPVSTTRPGAGGLAATSPVAVTTRRTATPTPRPSQSPTAAPSPPRTPQGNPSPAGSARPTHGPSSHPSPKNTKRSVSTPSPTPTATAS